MAQVSDAPVLLSCFSDLLSFLQVDQGRRAGCEVESQLGPSLLSASRAQVSAAALPAPPVLNVL